jgi:hypothetical protein
MHPDILCSFMKFRERGTFFVASVKKQISVLQHCYLHDYFLSFLHMSQKMSFHSKTLWVNINCSDVH